MNIVAIERIIKVSIIYQYTKARSMYQIGTFGSLLTINEKQKFPYQILAGDVSLFVLIREADQLLCDADLPHTVPGVRDDGEVAVRQGLV